MSARLNVMRYRLAQKCERRPVRGAALSFSGGGGVGGCLLAGLTTATPLLERHEFVLVEIFGPANDNRVGEIRLMADAPARHPGRVGIAIPKADESAV
jgi:hypothetical protein